MLFELFYTVAHTVINFVHTFGYIGIFIMTFVESTFIPIPSEITLIPAGYLIYQEHMNITPAILASISGTLLGSLLNYTIALKFGRKIFMKYGKYFFLKQGQLESLEKYFINYGSVSTFFGRMLPGIKHFISFPAGLAKMNLKLFCLYTTLGSLIWLCVLLYFGYIIGGNQQLIAQYIKRFNIFIIFITITLVFYLIWRNKLKKSKNRNSN